MTYNSISFYHGILDQDKEFVRVEIKKKRIGNYKINNLYVIQSGDCEFKGENKIVEYKRK